MKSLKEDIKQAKDEIGELKETYFEKSFASMVLSDYKKANKRMFITWVITFIALICVVIYCIYY
jgi:hypothetical protein